LLEDEARRRRLVKRIETGILLLAAGILVGLPLALGTSTYPFAIVQGNSMYPNLQNGDLVIFTGAPTPSKIPNGTIIIFVQSSTGLPVLDSLTKPIVIHRVVGIVQVSGSVFYRTKGDNNELDDPQLVPANHVLGIPAVVIPRVGVLFLFISSPQGLVAVTAVITIIYLGRMDEKASREERKDQFLRELAGMVLDGELPEQLFSKIELGIRYGKQSDGSLPIRISEWIEKGGLDHEWTVRKAACSKCSESSKIFEGSRNDALVACPNCLGSEFSMNPQIIE
jgi:signal peptidase I